MMRALIPIAALVATAAIAAPTVPEAAKAPFAASPLTSPDQVPVDWWRLFDDPALDTLIAASLAANVDLRIAFANLDAARAAQSQANRQRLPQTAIESGLTVDKTSAQPSASTIPSTDWDVASAVSWDVDLFGKLRSGALAARADAEAQQAAYEGVRVAVVADTIAAYVDLCAAERGRRAAADIAAAQDRSAALARDQLAVGEVSPLEVAQASTLAASSRAAITPFEAQRANALYRLGLLQGKVPAEARRLAIECPASPFATRVLPVGDGAALLLRRPDLRQADRKLAAAAARVGVARADLYPKINLGAALGLLAGRFDAALTPLISWSFPYQGVARAKLRGAKADEQAALATWDKAVLNALREVETALAAYDAEMRRNHDLATALDEAALYARRAAARVRIGDAAPLLAIDAERVHAAARLAKVQSDQSVAQAQVALFRALGGGWQITGGKG